MKMFSNISRKAILIGCPGNKDNFLSGVKPDLLKMSKFLQSDKGGAWKSQEILSLENPYATDVMTSIGSAIADYVFVYFSGHGYTEIDNSRMIMLRDKSICDLYLLNDSPRQLVVVDACRNYSVPTLGGFPEINEDVNHFEQQSTYEYFNDCIAASAEGKLIVHSTQPGKYSYDSVSGGLFSQALLTVANQMKSDSCYSPCRIQNVIRYIPTLRINKLTPQIPCVAYERGLLTVPFALTLIALPTRQRNLDFSTAIAAAIVTAIVVALFTADFK
jgi:Caspase domain